MYTADVILDTSAVGLPWHFLATEIHGDQEDPAHHCLLQQLLEQRLAKRLQ